MPDIHINQIKISPNRQRQEFEAEAMQELVEAIEYTPGAANRQLMHPPVLRCQEVNGKLEYTLVAGERRLKAMQQIFALGGAFLYDGVMYAAEDEMVPYSDLGALTLLEAEEAELDENLKRKDLTWQEHAAAVKRLHELRQAQMQQSIAQADIDLLTKGVTDQTVGEGDKWTVADTAREVLGTAEGYHHETIRKEILVAAHLDNPAIAKAKDVREAFKILQKDEQRAKNIELAVEVGKTFTVDSHKILQVDCLEWMKDQNNWNQFDVIATDPPYGMGAHEFGDAGGKMTAIDHQYDDSYESWQKLMLDWGKASYRVAKAQAHAYVFCDFDNFHELKGYMQEAGWYVFRTPLILHKINSGRVPLPELGPRRQYEIILYAIKGKKPTTHIYPDLLSIKADEGTEHGAKKPVAAWQNLLMRSVKPGDKILDSFAGSGGIIPAGHSFKCEVTALEVNPEYYGLCLKRAQEIKLNENVELKLDLPAELLIGGAE